MTVPPLLYTETFQVRAYEADPSGRATLPALCNYFQEAAGNHATALGLATDQLGAQDLAWVLARLRLRVGRYPAWREAVTFETWPSAVDRLYAYRDFRAVDSAGAELMCGVSDWLLINPATRRPARMPEWVAELRRPERARMLPPAAGKATTVNDPTHNDVVRVRREDIDLMDHVNNVRYVAWIVEAGAEALGDAHEPASLDLAFRAESGFGDTLHVETSPSEDDPSCLHHRIRRDADGVVAAHGRSTWRPV